MGGVQGPGQVPDHPRYLLSGCEVRRCPVLSLSRGLWRSLVSASVWGTEGRRFKSSQPDNFDAARHRNLVNHPFIPRLRAGPTNIQQPMPDLTELHLLTSEVSGAAQSLGFSAGSYEIVRIGTNIVLCDRQHRLVARVTSADPSLDALNEWLCTVRRIARSGAPILAPLHQDAIQINTHQCATFWPLADDSPLCNNEDLASLLSRFHSIRLHPEDRPWSYLARCKARLTKISESSMTDSIIQRLHELADSELMSFDLREYPNPVLVHGDAHPSNVVSFRERLLFIDLDNVGSGPREIDLAPYAVSCRRFPTPQKSWSTFRYEYNEDLDDDLLARLIRIRELTMIIWLASLWTSRPDAQVELSHRLDTLNGHDHWTAM